MEIHRLVDAAEVGREAAGIVCSFSFPGAALGLPTGATPIPMYEELARMAAARTCDLSGATVWAIDEFCGVAPETPGTNASYYRQHLSVPVRELYCPNAADNHPARHIEEYAAAIRSTGGLDLAVLGVGTNGHVAFNEPGSGRDAPARLVDLEAESRAAHAEAFGGLTNVPAQGMTLGIADLLEARAIIVLATGAHKAEVVRAAVEDPPTAGVPASWLQTHERVVWLLDVTAASKLAHV